MHTHKQNLKAFPVPGNEAWSAVVRGPEWSYGQWSFNDIIVFVAPGRSTEGDHLLLPGPRFPLSLIAERLTPIPLLGGVVITLDNARILAEQIQEWMNDLSLPEAVGA